MIASLPGAKASKPGDTAIVLEADGPWTAANGDLFEVAGVHIVEALSKPYRITVDLVSPDPDVDLRALIDTRMTVCVVKVMADSSLAERRIPGIVTEFAFIKPLNGAIGFHYRAVIEPEVVKLDRSRQNQIYGTTDAVSVVDIIEKEITGADVDGITSDSSPHLPTSRLQIRVSDSYPKRDFTVQYRETDFDFVSRLMEHWGLFYTFEPGANGETLVVADHTGTAVLSEVELPFVMGSGMNTDGQDTLRSFRSVARPVPKRVILRDYDMEQPHLTLEAEAVVDPDGYGVQYSYGDHFTTAAEGAQLAKIRAEELAWQGHLFEGESDCPQIGAGSRVTVSDHPREALNDGYTIIAVEHWFHTETSFGRLEPGQEVTGRTPYRNSFRAIPDHIPFRPLRETAVPRVAGLMAARVDAEGSGTRAELDDEGRYKVRLPFDLSGRPDGKASCYVRMAQPYAGTNSGMHFPLLKDTDVSLAYFNGDPDRPLITGAVPNPLKRSPSTAGTNDRNRICSTTGILFEMGEPQSGGGGGSGGATQGHLSGPAPVASVAADGAAAPMPEGPNGPPTATGAEPRPNPEPASAVQRHQSSSSLSESNPGSAVDSWARLDVSSSTKPAYLRLGVYNASSGEDALDTVDVSAEAENNGGSYSPESDGTAWFDYAKGKRLSVTTSDRKEVIGGKWSQYIVGDSISYVDGLQDKTVEKNTNTTQIGAEIKHNLGYYHRSIVGLNTSTYAAGKIDVFVGAKLGFAASIEATFNLSYKNEYTLWKVSNVLWKDDNTGISTKKVGMETNYVGIKVETVGLEQKTKLLDKKNDMIVLQDTVLDKDTSLADMKSNLAGLKDVVFNSDRGALKISGTMSVYY